MGDDRVTRESFNILDERRIVRWLRDTGFAETEGEGETVGAIAWLRDVEDVERCLGGKRDERDAMES
jgi:hypothetical protein